MFTWKLTISGFFTVECMPVDLMNVILFSSEIFLKAKNTYQNKDFI